MGRRFWTISIVGIIVVVGLISVILFFRRDEDYLDNPRRGDGPPVLIKNIGIDFDDFKFIEQPLPFDRLFIDYGFSVPANDAGPARFNPQPTFILPLGTKVYALIDGVVVDIPKLYSGDYSVMVAPDKDSNWAYETEHVINVRVKVGDVVRAGQVVAEVSGYDADNHGGFGLVEIGILRGGNPPMHLCPFKYLDPAIKEDVEKDIFAFYKKWERFRNDESLYDELKYIVPGCLILDEIEG